MIYYAKDWPITRKRLRAASMEVDNEFQKKEAEECAKRMPYVQAAQDERLLRKA